MKEPFVKPQLFTKSAFCAGCGHGIIARMVDEVLEEENLLDNCAIGAGVGCCGNYRRSLNIHDIAFAHGRGAAVSRGFHAAYPDVCMVAYQGDGDAYVIGFQETLNAAYSNSNIVMIVVNNFNFAMTGGQMSWTTLPGQKTTSSPYGRSEDANPIRVPELIANSFHPAFVARGSVHTLADIRKTKDYIRKAVRAQQQKRGYSLVEILAQCPTNSGLSPLQCNEWIEKEALRYFPLGVFQDDTEEK